MDGSTVMGTIFMLLIGEFIRVVGTREKNRDSGSLLLRISMGILGIGTKVRNKEKVVTCTPMERGTRVTG